jgi:hypothetical protein
LAAYALAQRAARDLLARGVYEPLLAADLTYADAEALFGPQR